mmetsp:Transcript_21146/g.36302  ORF Transcript_21146/g.36302 Transcript_21146/m.36302 type:complete len:289 (-) Transcript_21146:831-1697(-)|eukprot:CAMPEP_0196657248 /NCGR_PEP_ID=MMETSP1086-20130531/22536_1 /TAXON_ID=77921 /ORGANISM="Cyanoptyche  gloeocystis , Strain SAG4.97" /LENGTH=288 /DNA_ID=CAMNT_0041990307 /DNA_START=187 /DNA_END=1053 /DNA_ORIENTATION=+
MRFFTVSDIHADHSLNWDWVQNISDTEYRKDSVLLLAGDVCDDLKVVRKTLYAFTQKFARVFYIPGNHELWTVPGKDDNYKDSLDKMNAINLIADELGVETGCAKIGSIWIAPLFSWYDDDFDEDRTPDPAVISMWTDYRYCRWPKYLQSHNLAQYFLEMNKSTVRQVAQDATKSAVLTFTHFLPRRELLPEKEKLYFNLYKVAGSLLIDEQLRRMGATVHCFGHSHIPVDVTIEGVRYISNPLGYPCERIQSSQIPGPHEVKLVWRDDSPLADDSDSDDSPQECHVS